MADSHITSTWLLHGFYMASEWLTLSATGCKASTACLSKLVNT